MNSKKAASLIGLAMKAGKVVSGEFASEKAIRQGSAQLILIAEDASENTKKKFTDMSRYRKLPCYVFLDREGLGHLIGKEYRACAVLTDPQFAQAVRVQLSAPDPAENAHPPQNDLRRQQKPPEGNRKKPPETG